MHLDFNISLESPKNWDDEILSFEYPEICQTSMFGSFIQLSGETPAYITIYDNGDRIGNCLVEISRQKIATWYYGPLIVRNYHNHQEEILQNFIQFLRKKGIIAVENAKTQKCFASEDSFDQTSQIYTRLGESPFIDIRPSMDELLHLFDRSVRGKVNKCEKLGVEVVIAEDQSLVEQYMDLLTWYRNSRGFHLPSFHPNYETMKLFNNSTTSMGIALAKYEGELLAGMGFVTVGEIMTELALATSQKYEDCKIPVNDYLKTKAIEFYKEKGITIYDLAGGEKNPSEAKKKNILSFKQKFATNYAPYGMIDRSILSPKWYPIAMERKVGHLYAKYFARKKLL